MIIEPPLMNADGIAPFKSGAILMHLVLRPLRDLYAVYPFLLIIKRLTVLRVLHL